jgi:hypothetical protein
MEEEGQVQAGVEVAEDRVPDAATDAYGHGRLRRPG